MQNEDKKYKKLICKNIAKSIKQLRKAQNKSITQLSNEVDLSKSIWADLEKGIKDPQLTTLWKISEALDVPLSEVIKNVEILMPKNKGFLEG